MSTTHISTVRQVVDALGGTVATAELLNIVPSAVSNMLRDGHIPRGYHFQLFAELEARGHRVNTADLFGIQHPKAPQPSDAIAAA